MKRWRPLRVLIATDAFPPVCGGSGWSTYELVRGLRARGHELLVVRAMPGTHASVRTTVYDDVRVIEFGARAPDVPYVRNYFKNERLYARLEAFLFETLRQERMDLLHAQHVLTCPPAVSAARRGGVPSICTVRDYWPVCYWSDLLHTADGATLCPACSASMMTQCIRPRAGALWPMALPMIPYMRFNLARKGTALAEADGVIAVSTTIADDLRRRAPGLAATRLVTIPNAVDVAALRAAAAASPPPVDEPYALYLGKLAPNKGSAHLAAVADRARLDWPLIVAGDGPDRQAIAAAAARATSTIRLLGWVDRSRATALLAHASLLIFPSRGPESLSRVLIEASALGVPIAAMHTGGTADIVAHERTGLLSTSPEGLADDVRRLRDDPSLRARLGAAAAERAAALFDVSAVVAGIEALYFELLEQRS